MIIKPTAPGGRRAITARLGGHARVWMTLLLVCAMTVSTVALAGEAAAATPTFGVEVGYDGTGWDAGGNPTAATCRITGTGGDNSAHDGVVCTNDDVGYNWTYSIPANTAVTATFVQTLPANTRWNASDVQQCQGGSSFSYTGTGSISADGLTLTCTITWPSSANSVAGSIPVSAHVLATFPNGAPLHTVLSVDGTPFSPADVTVRSQSQVDLRKTALIISSGGNNYYDILVGIAGINTLNTDNPKGIAALTSPITLTDVLQPAGVTGSPATTALQSCYTHPYTSDPQVAPGAAGSWTCSQPGGPGTPIQITITGADTSGEGSPAIAGGTTVLAGAILVRIPKSAFTTAVQFYDQLTGFDPTDVNGQSNYGTGFEPGGAPGDTCLNPAKNNNCAVTAISLTYHSVLQKAISFRVPPVLPEVSPGVPYVTPNQRFYSWLRVSTSQPVTDLVVCDIIDPSKQQVDLSAPSYKFPFYPSGDLATNVTVQYTNRPFASDAERSAANCGTANDTTTDGPWFSDLTAAGGAANVTGIRLILPSYDPGAQGQFIPYFPMRNVETTPGAHVFDWASFADPAGILRTSGQYVVSDSILSLTKRAVASNGSTTTAAPAGSSLGYELTPTFISSLPDPQTLTIVDDLPNCELSPTVDAGSPWTLTVTRAADYGPDGIPCTGDDGAGMQVRFDTTAPVNPNSPPLLRYHVQIASNALNNTPQTNTAVISSPGNGQPASQRDASTTVNLLGASEIKMIKTADNATAQPGDPVDYRLVWSNTSNTSVGTTRWIDVLPYNGDARGTVISGSLALSAVEILGTPTADVTLEYTAAAPASVNPDPSVAGSTVWCTAAQFGSSGCPADLAAATALRVTVGNLSSGRVGGVHLTLTPTGEQAGDTYRNNVGPGRAANLTAAVPPSQTATVDLVASSIGDLVWWDHNRNGVQDPGEPGIPNVTVHYQGVTSGNVTTDANGHYTVPGLRAGDYRVTVTGGLPPGAAPVYDLDNGTTGANSDSGTFTLALGADRTDVDFGYAANETVTTAISSGPNAVAGAVVHDSVTFTGGLHGTYTPRLLGPVAPNNAGTCAGLDWSSATVVTDPAMAVNADGTLSTPSHALGAIGCYTYAGTFQGPGGITITLVTGDPTETALVTRRTPTVTTTASTNNAGPGTVISDSVAITGLGAANPATLTWQFIGPVPPSPSGSCAGL
ncbi:MAG: hypothetical protein QOE97_2895, partial [Pseudonocardiales bacterium]|nr:hypothetical protein [Pseudonocardiales bacterium]